MEIVPSLAFALWAIPVLVATAVLGGSIGSGGFAPMVTVMALFPAALMFALAVLAGAVLTPALLPLLPGRAFTVKGAVAGALLAMLGLLALPGMLGLMSPWGWAAVVLAVAAGASYIAVNFTGATPYTSPSGVELELRRALPVEVTAMVVALACWAVAWATRIGS
jgi:hypothetical protein